MKTERSRYLRTAPVLLTLSVTACLPRTGHMTPVSPSPLAIPRIAKGDMQVHATTFIAERGSWWAAVQAGVGFERGIDLSTKTGWHSGEWGGGDGDAGRGQGPVLQVAVKKTWILTPRLEAGFQFACGMTYETGTGNKLEVTTDGALHYSDQYHYTFLAMAPGLGVQTHYRTGRRSGLVLQVRGAMARVTRTSEVYPTKTEFNPFVEALAGALIEPMAGLQLGLGLYLPAEWVTTTAGVGHVFPILTVAAGYQFPLRRAR